MTTLRSWIAGALGFALIATVVLVAADHQRSTSRVKFTEMRVAARMQVAILRQQRGIDEFLATGSPDGLRLYYEAQLQLSDGLAEATRVSASSSRELRATHEEADAYRRWGALATAAIVRRQARNAVDSASLQRQRDAVVEEFLADNDTYQDQLLAQSFDEERRAALLPVWLLLGVGALLGCTAGLLKRRRTSGATRQAAAAASQAGFAEAVQFAEDEREAHELLRHHLEATVPLSDVLVLNRNNSADRLEPTHELADAHPLKEELRESEPRSCLAVRLSRRYERGGAQLAETLACRICGLLPRLSSCQPLLVGGEVIGSVLVVHDRPLRRDVDVRVRESISQAAPVLANLRNLAIAESRAATDALTGLPNRRTVDDTIRRMHAQADRSDTPFSVALLDLDHFKQINDDFGHEAGDNALAALAALLRAELRTSDFAGRSGGEEFVLFFPNTTQAEATLAADKIRLAIRKLRVAGIDRSITASIGIATFPDNAATPQTLMRAADRALYSAKQHGRDRTESTTPPDETRLVAI